MRDIGGMSVAVRLARGKNLPSDGRSSTMGRRRSFSERGHVAAQCPQTGPKRVEALRVVVDKTARGVQPGTWTVTVPERERPERPSLASGVGEEQGCRAPFPNRPWSRETR